jgi:excisionase family DNA binding protein
MEEIVEAAGRRGMMGQRADPSRRLLSMRQVCERFGVCDRTIERWLENPKLSFPRPRRINTRRYWLEDELDAFDETAKTA